MPRATNFYLCHIVQPNVKRFIKHFGAIQINPFELTAYLQPPAWLRPVPAASFLSIPDTLSYYSVGNRFTLRSYPGTVSW